MKRAALLAILAGCAAPPAPVEEPPPPAGTVAGRVLHAGRPLADVFVHVKRGLEGRTFPMPAGPVTLDQVGFQFVPKVFGLRAGQTLRITSQDTSPHNVNCQPFANAPFNENVNQGDVIEKRFAAPEVMVLLQCNIHYFMKAYAGVVTHPFHAVTDAEGRFEIAGLPPGDYELEAWQEDLGARRSSVHLGPDRGTRVSFQYD